MDPGNPLMAINVRIIPTQGKGIYHLTPTSKKTSQRGFITIEFIFALCLSLTLTYFMIAMTITLSTTSLMQYFAYSSARAGSAANINPDLQRTAARNKFNSLIGGPALAPMLDSGWFSVTAPDIRQGINGATFENDLGGVDPRPVFHGVRTTLLVNVLKMRIPFVGSINPEDGDFVLNPTAVVFRESSFKECNDFMEVRTQNLFEAPSFGGRLQSFRQGQISTIWEDNGC